MILSKKCIEELEKNNYFVSKIKLHNAIEMLENLIKEGKELFCKYQEYDRSILLDIVFSNVGSNGFSNRTFFDIKKEVSPIIYFSTNLQKTGIDARVYDAVKVYFLDQNYYAVKISSDKQIGHEIPEEIKIKIIQNLSANSTVYFSAFDLNAYKMWKERCKKILTAINYDNNVFQQHNEHPLASNPDKHFLDRFEREIEDLKTTQKLFCSFEKISLKWLKFKRKIANFFSWVIKKICDHCVTLFLTSALGILVTKYSQQLKEIVLAVLSKS